MLKPASSIIPYRHTVHWISIKVVNNEKGCNMATHPPPNFVYNPDLDAFLFIGAQNIYKRFTFKLNI